MQPTVLTVRGFAILALDYATSLNGFVLRYVIKKSLRRFLATLLK